MRRKLNSNKIIDLTELQKIYNKALWEGDPKAVSLLKMMKGRWAYFDYKVTQFSKVHNVNYEEVLRQLDEGWVQSCGGLVII